MPTISVIMPSYNVVAYIEKCMESVVGQSFRDLEILCIDAGSTDGTYECLDRFAVQDPRIRLIRSDKKSYGYQINLGISLARGHYIGIVETDDFIAEDMYSFLYELIRSEGADFAKGNTIDYYDLDYGQVYSQIRRGREARLFLSGNNKAEVIPREFPDILWYDFHVWNGLYESTLLKRVHLNETPGAAYQDTGFMFQMYTGAERGIFSDYPVYYYRRTNKEASAYDPKAISNLAFEFGCLFDRVDRYGKKWKRALALKMLCQIIVKMNLMGYQGRYWIESEKDLYDMQKWLRESILPEGLPDELKEPGELFLKSPECLYEKYAMKYKPVNQNIADLLSFVEGRPVALFGAGMRCQFAAILLMSQGKNLFAVCDNSKEKLETKIRELTVCTPEKALEREPDAVFVITAGRRLSAEEISDQLVSLGVKRDDIFFYTAGTDNMLLLR